jgi:hypothetical protein
MFAVILTAQAQSFLTNGLVAYYPFSNGSTNDFSGNGNTGTNYGGTFTTDRLGLPNSALFLKNTNNTTLTDAFCKRIWVPAQTLNNLTSGTISAWINPNDVTHGAIFAKQDGGVNTMAVFSVGGYSDPNTGLPIAGTAGTLYFHPQDYTPIAQSSSGLVVAGNWQHVCVAFSSTNCVFYINGKLAGSTTGNFSVPSDLNASCWTSIGALAGGFFDAGNLRPQQWFYGLIDDVRIYNRALATNEVAQLYAIESAPIVNIQKAVYISSSNLNVGTNYQVQVSSDLLNWTNSGSVFTATTNSWRSTNYWDVANWNSLFFRIQQQ